MQKVNSKAKSLCNLWNVKILDLYSSPSSENYTEKLTCEKCFLFH